MGTHTRRPGGRHQPFSTPAASPSVGHWLADHVLALCLFGILLLALLAEMPWLSRPVRVYLLQAAVVLVYTLIAAAGPASGRLSFAALRGPSLWLLGLLVWSALSAARAPYPTFAVAEMLRLALGAGVYFTAAYVLRPQETRLMPYLLLGLGAAVSLHGLIEFGSAGNASKDVIVSVFHNHENFGSFLVLLLPLGLALALDRKQVPWKLLFAQGGALLIGAALLLARTRSAWIGAIAGSLLLVILTLRFSSIQLDRANRALIVGPTLLVTLAFVGLMTFGQMASIVSTRAATLAHAGDDGSFLDRLHRWRSACRMASEHPLTGWGLGAWPVMQGRWTHQGDDVSKVLTSGTDHSNIAHNFWVQWGAETGGVGLALQFGLLAAFLLAGLRALTTPDRERRTLLLGCLAAVVAGGVDMIGAPSYTFPGVSSLFWAVLGLGVAILREQGGAAILGRRTEWLVPLCAGLISALIVLGAGWKLRADGKGVPHGTLSVTAMPAGQVAPGTRILWTALYRDPSGQMRPTAPGVVWKVTSGRLGNPGPKYIRIGKGVTLSAWGGDALGEVAQVTVQASYWDNFSRHYSASRTVLVKSKALLH